MEFPTVDVTGSLKVCVCGHIKAEHHIERFPGPFGVVVTVLKCTICSMENKVCANFMAKDSVIVKKI